MDSCLNKNLRIVNRISLCYIACNLCFPNQNIKYMTDRINYMLEMQKLDNNHRGMLISILHW